MSAKGVTPGLANNIDMQISNSNECCIWYIIGMRWLSF